MTIKFIDLFAGTGGMRLALEASLQQSGLESQCVFTSEIDEKACETYELNFGETPHGDIEETTNLIPPFDFMLAGFPCQPFSYAGKRKGFGDTRGTLFFEIIKILKEHKPKGFLLENVRGLTTHDKGRTFETIISSLKALGYATDFKFGNSSNFGVPQNRVRIFIFGILDKKIKTTIPSDTGAADSHTFKRQTRQLQLFSTSTCRKTVGDILEPHPDPKYICSKRFSTMLNEAVGGDFEKLHGVRLIDYRGGNSLHSWDLGMKGDCSNDERMFMNLLISNRRKKIFGTDQDGKMLTKSQIITFFDNPKIDGIMDSLLQKGYLKSVDGRFNPVCGNMSFEVFKFLDPDSISITLTSSDTHKLGVVQNGTPRRITPREAARLQGFPESFILHPNDTYAYKQFGNAVSVPVVEAILSDIITNNKILGPQGAA